MSEPQVTESLPWDWQISVVCQNEAARIGACLSSIRQAIGSRRALVTLNLNGSTDDSDVVAQRTAHECGLLLQVYRTQTADKSNALNQFIYKLRQPARMYVFVDGYVRIGADALEGLDQCLATHPYAMAATGVALNGRTMRLATEKTLEEGGVLHGQLHALRPEFLDRMVRQNIHLPLGTYYGDGLMGALVNHNLDALGQAWDTRRIVGVGDATYEISALSMFRPRDVRRQLRRKVRQMRGKLQNQAMKEIIYRHGFAALPGNADDLVRDHISEHAAPAVSLIDRPFMALALRQIRGAREFDPAGLVPRCVNLLDAAERTG